MMSSKDGYLPIIENINKDLSSIYLTSNQSIPLSSSITNNPTIKSNIPRIPWILPRKSSNT